MQRQISMDAKRFDLDTDSAKVAGAPHISEMERNPEELHHAAEEAAAAAADYIHVLDIVKDKGKSSGFRSKDFDVGAATAVSFDIDTDDSNAKNTSGAINATTGSGAAAVVEELNRASTANGATAKSGDFTVGSNAFDESSNRTDGDIANQDNESSKSAQSSKKAKSSKKATKLSSSKKYGKSSKK